MHIIISGMIGAGKSTLATMLGNHYDIPIFYESVDDNPYLNRFYDQNEQSVDLNRYGFLIQLYFLNHRYKTTRQAFKHESAILDRSIYEDNYFATVNYLENNISVEEYELYTQINKKLLNVLSFDGNVSSPDLMIYLKGDFESIIKRINSRGRESETQNDNLEYFESIWKGYDTWANEYNHSPMLIIDIDKWDWFNPEHLEHINNTVEKIINDPNTNSTTKVVL